MADTPINPDIEQIIRESLAATKSWEWADDDRKWSAAVAAGKYMQAHGLIVQMAQVMVLKIVEDIMKEEHEPTDRPDAPELDDEELARIEEYLRKSGYPPFETLVRINLGAQSVASQEPQEPDM